MPSTNRMLCLLLSALCFLKIHGQSVPFSSYEQAKKHSLSYHQPAVDFFEGALLGNGGLGAVVTTRPDGIMIYFGQEVGETGTGAEGFQSDDGRTTIFDYWGVAEHQKWMNGGRFDGGLLSAEQKRLRSVYATLLTFVKQSEAIYSGDYADLTGYNVSLANFASSVHAFLRFSDRERLLIVNNFSSTEMDITIKIPDELLQRLGISDGDEYIATDVLGSTFEVAFAKDRTLPFHLPPHGSFIFKLSRKKI